MWYQVRRVIKVGLWSKYLIMVEVTEPFEAGAFSEREVSTGTMIPKGDSPSLYRSGGDPLDTYLPSSGQHTKSSKRVGL